jgi:hypothetical protein
MMYLAVIPTSTPEHVAQRRDTIDRYFAAIQSGDSAVLHEVLTPGAITSWPQSGERITGAMSCALVYANYPGGPPSQRVQRISGDGKVWVAELVADYGEERWHTISVFEFDGPRIARITDYFGPTFRAAEWRREWVDREDAG